MTKIPSVVFLAIGIVLLVFGLDATDSFTSTMNRAATGTPAENSVWLIGLGVVGILSGTFGLFFRKTP